MLGMEAAARMKWIAASRSMALVCIHVVLVPDRRARGKKKKERRR
jgi:hypothetical protein